MSVWLSVVIPVKSGSEGIDRLLQSLANQRDIEPFEVHVVLNPKWQRIRNPGLDPAGFKVWLSPAGVNHARNVGIEHCHGEWIYFLDADCVLHDPQHLSQLVRQLKTAKPDTIYGGPYILPEGSAPVARAYHWIQDRWIREGWHPQHGWVHLLGGNLVVARSQFTALRFDDSILFGGSETDFLARMLQQGGKAEFLPQLGVLHVQSLTTRQLLHKAFLQGYGFERLIHRGLWLKGPRRSLTRSSERRELAKLLGLYAEVFALGRDAFVQSPKQAPKRPRIFWRRLKNRVLRRWYHPSPFAVEVQRWRKARSSWP